MDEKHIGIPRFNSVITIDGITVDGKEYELENGEIGWFLRTWGEHSPVRQCWIQNKKFYKATIGESSYIGKLTIEILDQETTIEPERGKAIFEAIKKWEALAAVVLMG